MKISHIKISNILGINELELTPGGFNTISGRNGTGKSSVLEAVKSAFKGGHDATLLRNGEKKGEVVLVLDDGTEIRKRVTASTSTTDVVRDGKKVTRPGEAIKALTDMLSVNPVEFLRADAKDRVKVLLESVPFEIDAERLAKISGVDVPDRPGTHALNVINLVRTTVYDNRTGTNRAISEKSGTLAQLRQALPPDGAGADGDEQGLQAKLEEADTILATEKKRIDDKLDGLRKTRDASIQERRDKINELEREILGIQQEWTSTEQKANTQRQKNSEKHLATVTPIKASLQQIRNDREAYARRQQTLDMIATMETELEALEGEAAKATEALDAIDKYKLELLGTLPVSGLEVRDGELFRNNIPFDRLNTAQQVEIAVEIAAVRAGDLSVICVDGLELMDSDTLAQFREQAESRELQLFITRVADSDLSIADENQ